MSAGRNMNILIIGAAGFIGKELTEKALAEGHKVLACDVAENAPYERENYEYYRIENDEVPAECAGRADCMVLLAAKRPYDGFNMDDYFFNVRIFDHYFRIAVSSGIKNIVFASSKAVYSGDGYPWRETDVCVPSSLYGASKLACEQLGAYLAEKQGVSFKALRFAQVIGRGERKGFLINTLIDNAAAKKTQEIYGTGEQRRHYVYVKDVCGAILSAAENDRVSGVFNIGMANAVSNLEMAECVNTVFGNEGNLVHNMDKDMKGSDDALCVQLALEKLGFSAKYDLAETFRDLAAELNG